MSVSEKDKSVTAEAAALRLIYGPNAAKKIARQFDIAVVTAKFWLAGRMPVARRREIAAALVTECDRLESMIAETRRRWAEVADDETSSAVARVPADRDGSAAGGVGRARLNSNPGR